MQEHREDDLLPERLAELEAANESLRGELDLCRREHEALRLGEERYRSLVEATTAIVWNAPSSGNFESEQPRWGEFTGQSFEELKGWGWLNAVHPDDRPNTARVWSAAVARRSLYQVEHRLLRHDGVYRHMLVRAVPILDQNGAIREWVGVHTDFTGQKEVESALREAKAMAEAASQAKSDFLANMSHEIRTPINGVLGMTELALDTNLTTEQRRYLELVKISADSLLVIVNDILDFSKIEAGKIELEAVPFSLSDRMGDTLKTLALRAHRKGLELACHFAPGVPNALVGDPARLGQVILNLVGNAIKFTAEGEVVLSVRTCDSLLKRLLPAGECVDVQTYEAAVRPLSEGYVTLAFSVRDTGQGIAEDKQTRMFQPFTQADTSTTRQFGGTGLGLTIAKRLVEMMGGRIGFESEEGAGSTFYFTANFGLRTPGTLEPEALPVNLQGKRVLVVDDNNTNRLILEEILSRWGATATLADGAGAALEEMDSAAGAGLPFALVLSDVMMPNIDGFQLAERIKLKSLPRVTPVILLSSADRQPTAARCREAGVVAYLTKPVKQSELLDAVLSALASPTRLAEAASVEREPRAQTQEQYPSRPLTILLVEDNAVNRLLAVTLLEKAGHAVDTAQNGKEALSALASRDYEVVLMDVQMPEMDGFEATGRIRRYEQSTGKHQPIIAMTAHAMKEDRQRCLDAGMDGYITKPVRSKELYQILASFALENFQAGQTAQSRAVEEGDGASNVAIDSTQRAYADRRVCYFDKSTLVERIGGREDRLPTIIQIFLDESSRQLAGLEKAIASGDAPTLQRLAHSLKGAGGVFGSSGLVESAAALESMGQTGQLSGAGNVYSLLECELKSLKAHLKSLASPNQASESL